MSGKTSKTRGFRLNLVIDVDFMIYLGINDICRKLFQVRRTGMSLTIRYPLALTLI